MLIKAADQLMAGRKPAAALREWLTLFVEFLDTKHGMAEAMDTLIGGPETLYSRTPHRLDVPIKALVAGGIATGVFRDDIEPHDLLRALAGVAQIRPSENWKRSAMRMVEPSDQWHAGECRRAARSADLSRIKPGEMNSAIATHLI